MSAENVLNEAFINASQQVKTLTEKPDNATLLKLYSLYKQGSEGDVHGEEPTNMFDFVGKAKYSAWEELKGMPEHEAQTHYINLVNELLNK